MGYPNIDWDIPVLMTYPNLSWDIPKFNKNRWDITGKLEVRPIPGYPKTSIVPRYTSC